MTTHEPVRGDGYRQLGALIKKNFLIKKRELRQTIMEILLPAIMIVVMFFMRGASIFGGYILGGQEGIQYFPVTPLPSLSALGCPLSTSSNDIIFCKLAYSPSNNKDINAIMESFRQIIASMPPGHNKQRLQIDAFEDEADFIAHHNNQYFAGIVFTEDPIRISDQRSYKYKIRWAISLENSQNLLNQTKAYAESGFGTVQATLAQLIAKYEAPNSLSNFTLQLNTAAMPERPSSLPINPFAIAWPFYFLMLFFSSTVQYVVSIVAEKEKKLKEMMKMMGCMVTAYNLSWLITASITLLASLTLFEIFAYALGIIEYSSGTLLLLIFALYGFSMIQLAYVVSIFFQKSKTAGFVMSFGQSVTVVVWIIVHFLIYARDSPFVLKCVTSLISPLAFAEIMYVFGEAEFDKIGLTWSNMTSLNPTFSIHYLLGLLIFDTIVYSLLAWYLDHIYTGEYGASASMLFFVKPQFWKQEIVPFIPSFAMFKTRRNYRKAPATSASSAEDNQQEGGKFQLLSEEDEDNVELMLATPPTSPLPLSSPSELQPQEEMQQQQQQPPEIGIKIENLRKVFKTGGLCAGRKNNGNNRAPNGITVAVEDLTLDIHKGSIFCLLGQNGAGKSTTIAVLTGLHAPTGGNALIHGLSIQSDMAAIRRQLGVCPQHNALWDQLTAEEHCQLYSAIKLVPREQTKQEIERVLKEVGIYENRKQLVSGFSGGMKRKLSVALAFLSDSPVIFLDEPTSGMDPLSRRAIWSMLQQCKHSKTIVLTTHSMEEADLLGDTIGIMKKGRLEVVGNSIFLKNHYGIGYNLYLVREPGCQEEQVSAFIDRFIVGKRTLTKAGSTSNDLTYLLPLESVSSFPDFLTELEANLHNLHVSSYGISMTTLEEVFLKFNDQADSADNN